MTALPLGVLPPAVVGALVVLAVLPWALTRPSRPLAPPPPRRSRTRPAPVDPAVLLDLLDIALAAGTSIPGALTALGDAIAPAEPADRLRSAGVALRLGADWDEAWHGCPPGLRPLAQVLEPAWVDGIDPCALVRHRAATVRAHRRRESREAAARLGARLVLPLGLCFLPAFVLLSMVPVLLSGAGLLGGP